MHYDFPADISIDEVRAAIANANARLGAVGFIEADRGDHVIFNYIVAFSNSFPTPNTGDPATDREYAILRECRGLTFSKDGRILNRKFAKFFNVAEKPETQIHVVDWNKPHVVLEKLDGSMITPIFLGDPNDIDWEKLRWCTKMGLTDVAKPVEAWVANNSNYARYAAHVMAAGFTPLFEWCSRQQRIVIDYPKDRLVLTAMRNNKTGEYLPYEELLKAETHGIEVVRALPGSVENIEAFMAETRDLEGAEGYIIRFEDGHMMKVKGQWYCQIHKTKELLQFEKDVVSMIAHNLLDDALPFMSEEDRVRVEDFQRAYELGVLASIERYKALYNEIIAKVGDDQKTFALHVNGLGLPGRYSKFLFNHKKGISMESLVRDTIAQAAHPTAGTQSRIDEIRDLFGGINWRDYAPAYVGGDD